MLDDIVQALTTESDNPPKKNTKAQAVASSPKENGKGQTPPWDADLSELKMEKMMGIGSYSETYLGKWARSKDSVIIKKLKDNTQSDPQESVARFREETEQLSRLSHPSLVPIIGACATTDAKYVIWQYIPV